MALRIVNFVVFLIATLALVAASSPRWMFGLTLLCSAAGVVLLPFWMLGVASGLTHRSDDSRVRLFLRASTAPGLTLLVVIALLNHAPLSMRIWLNENALLRAIAEFHAKPDQFLIGGPRHEETWQIGSFSVVLDDRGNGVSVPWGETVSFVASSGGGGGFIYSPKQQPMSESEGESVAFAPLWGPWYLWEDRD